MSLWALGWGLGGWTATVVTLPAGVLFYWIRQQLHYRDERRKARVAHMRRSIAANLHDELGSLLMRVHMQAEAMRHKSQTDDAGLERLLSTTTAALLAMRDVAWGLDPGADTVDALQDRMRDLLDQMAPTTALHISFVTEGLEDIAAVPGWMRQEIYQVFKEATTNVLRHAKGAASLAVRLCGYKGLLRLEVQDDGVPMTAPCRNGMGLRNMKLRAQTVGGKLEAGPRTDGPGFRVCMAVPLLPTAPTLWWQWWAK